MWVLIKLSIVFVVIYLLLNIVYFGFQFSVALNRSNDLIDRESAAFEKFIDNYMEITKANLKSLLINFERYDMRYSELGQEIVVQEVKLLERLNIFSEVYLVDFKHDFIVTTENIFHYDEASKLKKLDTVLNSNFDFKTLQVSNIFVEHQEDYFVLSVPYNDPDESLHGAVVSIINKENFKKQLSGFYNYNSKLKYLVNDSRNKAVLDIQVPVNNVFPLFNYITDNFIEDKNLSFKDFDSNNLDQWSYSIKPNVLLLFQNFHKEFMSNLFLSLILFIFLLFMLWNIFRKYEREIYTFFYHGYLNDIKKKFIKNSSQKFYITIIDINNFSNINKEYGYSTGDQILTHIIKEHELLKKDINHQMYYLGGDNFILAANYPNWKIAKERFREIREEFSKMFFVHNQRIIDLEFNFVLYQFDVDSYKTIEAFEKHLMMIEQIIKKRFKQRERNFLEFKNFRLVQTIYGKQEQMKDFLEKKIKENAFIPYFQSIVDLETMVIEKYEVLLRIDDRETGEILSPYPYIKIAEQYDLIKKVDYLLISKTLKMLTERKLELHLSFNLSSKELVDLTHIKKIVELIDWIGYKKELITFELTETSKISSFKDIMHTLRYLKSIGMKVALDDFGTGHSNFEMIKNLNEYCDYIKIDGLFIKNITSNNSDQFLVTSLVNLAKAYHMKVIAEYVENSVIEGFLKKIDVDLVQGFYYSEPKSLDGILESGDNL
jgi:EAL domain-containing protein (putative c-di-GMP-specific phosphodiesterase class I)/GGDEF domain-containing protein